MIKTDGKTLGPLSGITVLELGTMLAGPFTGTLLADFGANVIKVEQPDSGDPIRQSGPFVDGESLWWNVEGRNKRSITVDLRVTAGKDLIKRLVVESDVLIENFRPGTMDRWGLGYEALSGVNPALVMLSVSGYGQTGPYASRPAYDRMAQAFSGILNMTGFHDRPPVRSGAAFADYGTAIMGAFAIMMALYHRDAKGGRGQLLDVAMYETMFRLTENMVSNFDKFGTIRERRGNLHSNSAPGDHFRTSDGRYIVITVSNDALFGSLCKAMERDDLPHDPRFASHSVRAENLVEINNIVADWIASMSSEQGCARLDAVRQPYSLIYNVEDIVNDPHYKARDAIVTVQNPRIGPIRMPGVFPRMLGTPAPEIRPAPALGEDTDAILSSVLGMLDPEIQQLRRDKVI